MYCFLFLVLLFVHAIAQAPVPCATTTSSILLTGTCSILNRQQGCCTTNLPTPAQLNSQCSEACASKFWAYWCSLSCLVTPVGVPTNALGKPALCQQPLMDLYSACQSCNATGNLATTFDSWVSTTALYVNSAGNCINVTASEAVTSNIPVILGVDFFPGAVTIDSTTPVATITVRLNVTSTTPVFFGSVTITQPSAVGLDYTTLTFNNFVITQSSNNVWSSNQTFTLSTSSYSGTWFGSKVSARNVAGTATTAQTYPFTVAATYPTATYGDICVCPGACATTTTGSNTLVASTNASTLNLGCATTSLTPITVSSVGKASVTATTVLLNAPNVVFSSVSLTAATVQTGVANTIISLQNGASLVVTNTMTLSSAVAFVSDSTMSTVTIGSAATATCTAATTFGVAVTLQGILNLNTGCDFKQQGAITTIGNIVLNTPMKIFSDASFSGAGTVSGTGLLTIQGSTTTISNGYSVTAPIKVEMSATIGSKMAVAVVPPVVSVCSQASGSSATFSAGTTFDIRACNVAGCVCTTGVSVKVNGPLTMTSATLTFHEVGGINFGALYVTGTTTFSRVNVILNLASSLTTLAATIPIMQVDGNSCATIETVVTLTPSVAPRPNSLQCVFDSVAGKSTVSLVLAATSVVTSPAAVSPSYQFVSTSLYSVTLNLDCSTSGGSALFLDTISSTLISNRGSVSAAAITVVSVTCGSVIVNFKCSSSVSPSDADGLCSQIVSDATNVNSQLYLKLRGTSGSTTSATTSSSSNSALYGLFALCFIPIAICFCLVLWYRSRHREADNQYMQDTATFSNVAASPQPLGGATQTYLPAYAPQYATAPQFAPAPQYGAPIYGNMPVQMEPYPKPFY